MNASPLILYNTGTRTQIKTEFIFSTLVEFIFSTLVENMNSVFFLSPLNQDKSWILIKPTLKNQRMRLHLLRTSAKCL
jgi:hypothetical protein